MCLRLFVSWRRGNVKNCGKSIQAWHASVMVSVRFQLKAFRAFWNLAGNRRRRNSKCCMTYTAQCLVGLSLKHVICIWCEITWKFKELYRELGLHSLVCHVLNYLIYPSVIRWWIIKEWGLLSDFYCTSLVMQSPPSVCLSVCLYLLLLFNWLILIFCAWIAYDHGLQAIEG